MTMIHILDAQGATQGPFTPGQLREMIKTGRATWKTPAALAGDEEWLTLSSFADLLEPPQRTIVSTSSAGTVWPTKDKKEGGFDLVKAGVILLALAFILAVMLGLGLVELLLIAAGIILLVVGLCRK